MKALIITGKYVTDCEYSFCLYYLQGEGYTVDVATPDGKDTQGILGEKVRATRSIYNGLPSDVDIKDYSILILPGGAKAMEYLRQDEYVLRIIREFKGTIGAICHGTQLLISAGLVKGRAICGYYSIKDDIINAGGRYPVGDPPFLTDGKIVTSSHYKHLGHWMKQVLRVASEQV